MKRMLMFFGLLAAGNLTIAAQGQSVPRTPSNSPKAAFRPAVLRGVRIGVSTEKDVLRLLGAPRDRVRGEDGADYLIYYDIGPVPGKVEFSINPPTKRVVFATLQPTSATLDELLRVLGPGWVRRRYSIVTCPGRDEEGVAYEDLNGDAPVAELPRLGIAILTTVRPLAVEYLGKPYGLSKHPCPEGQPHK